MVNSAEHKHEFPVSASLPARVPDPARPYPHQKRTALVSSGLLNMSRAGFEPATPCLKGRCSTD